MIWALLTFLIPSRTLLSILVYQSGLLSVPQMCEVLSTQGFAKVVLFLKNPSPRSLYMAMMMACGKWICKNEPKKLLSPLQQTRQELRINYSSGSMDREKVRGTAAQTNSKCLAWMISWKSAIPPKIQCIRKH